MANLIKCMLFLACLMVSIASAQLPSSTNGPSSFYFYNPATLPTQNFATVPNPTTKHDITYHNYPTSTLLGSHVVFLTTCLKDLKDSNQKLEQTSKLLVETNTVVENVKKELEEIKQTPSSSIESFKNELNDAKQLLAEATAVIGTLKNDLNVVKQDVQSSKSKIGDLTTDVQSTKSKIGDLTTELTKSTATSSIGKIPASCADLQQIGHKKSGMFSIMESNKVVTVYCDFTKLTTDSGLQKWIGYADVKSLPTFFYAQKTAPFSTKGVPIPFEYERLNIGKAMNVQKGIFTAKRKGVYFFAYSGIATITAADGFIDMALMVNGNQVGLAECHSKTGGVEWETFSLQSTIDLQAGDQVWLQIIVVSSAFIQDDNHHFNHFTGWMLQEDISP